MLHGLRKALVLGAAIVVLGACTGKNYMVAAATDTNRALEESTNEMLLLNILRAKDQRPMYFTGLSTINVNPKVSASGTFSIPFGGDATNLFNFSPTLSAETRPQFNVQVLADKEFTKAIHTPVSLETFELFLNLGWPKQFLLFMFTENVQTDSGKVKNSTKLSEYARFKVAIARLSTEMKVDSTDLETSIISPILPANAIKNDDALRQIMEIRADGHFLSDVCAAAEIIKKEIKKKIQKKRKKITSRSVNKKWRINYRKPWTRRL